MSQTKSGTGDKLRLSVKSRKQIEVALSDVMIGGVIEVYPFVEKHGLLALNFRRRKVTITAGPYVGLIPLTPTIVVDVTPKMPVTNIARVLDVSGRSLKRIEGRDRYYRAEALTSESVLEFLAANLLEALREIEVQGLHKDYIHITEASSHPAGAIDFGTSIRGSWSRGHEHKIASRRFEQTLDIPINRVIKAALTSVLIQLGSFQDRRRTLVTQLASALSRFPKRVRPHRNQDVEAAQKVVDRNLLPAFRSYYYRPLAIAVMVLTQRGISLREDGEDAFLGMFIVNFEEVFEDYLRNALSAQAGNSLIVQNGNSEGKKPLFDNTSNQDAEPDIVLVSPASGRKLIVEVKYKDSPNRNDINQAVTYAVTYRTDRAVLVHQHDDGKPAGLRHLGKMNGISIETYAFDLAAANLNVEEHRFFQAMHELVDAV